MKLNLSIIIAVSGRQINVNDIQRKRLNEYQDIKSD